MFSNCSSLLYFGDISKSEKINAINTKKNLPNIPKRLSSPSLNNIINNNLFCDNNKRSLNTYNIDISKYIKSISYISNWNTNNVTNMSNIFFNCESLMFLPDISKWNTNNITNMSYMFCLCNSLS